MTFTEPYYYPSFSEKHEFPIFNTSGFDVSKTDMKGTVFIEKAADLEQYAQTEEDNMEAKIKAIAEAGVSLVVTGGTVSEMAMHFFERYKIMVFKTSSKFELRRICIATNAHGLLALVKYLLQSTFNISPLLYPY